MHRKKKRFFNPFLFTDGKEIFHKKKVPVIGLTQVESNRHHLYPKDRGLIPGVNKEKFLLRMWEYKHFKGWNVLFQFSYKEEGQTKTSELTIDEIITLMSINHWFVEDKVGTNAWKILFGEKNLNEALDLLCRMLAIKFNYQWQKTFPKAINSIKRKLVAI
jgi:hypothetical protein